MLNRDNINKIKGILSAKSGALAPKFAEPAMTIGQLPKQPWLEHPENIVNISNENGRCYITLKDGTAYGVTPLQYDEASELMSQQFHKNSEDLKKGFEWSEGFLKGVDLILKDHDSFTRKSDSKNDPKEDNTSIFLPGKENASDLWTPNVTHYEEPKKLDVPNGFDEKLLVVAKMTGMPHIMKPAEQVEEAKKNIQLSSAEIQLKLQEAQTKAQQPEISEKPKLETIAEKAEETITKPVITLVVPPLGLESGIENDQNLGTQGSTNGQPASSGADDASLAGNIKPEDITTQVSSGTNEEPKMILQKQEEGDGKKDGGTDKKEDSGETSFLDKAKNFLGSKGMKSAGNYASMVNTGIDTVSSLLVNKNDYASDSWTNSKGRETYDTIANSLAVFSPVGTILSGAMKVGALVNDVGGSKTLKFAVNKGTLSKVGGSYGGSSSKIYEAASKADKKYGLFEGGARDEANELIDEARRLLNKMTAIAKNAEDLQSASTIMSKYNTMGYQYQMNGGYDQRYLKAGKYGTKLLYFKLEFSVELSDPEFDEIEYTPIFKLGGTLLDLLDRSIFNSFKVTLTDITLPKSFKKGGTLKDRDIEVIETNTTQKSVIPEGALHKNKHHLDEVGIDDSELTKKGIPVVDNEGDQLAEIELNEIIFTLEVTKELESRYKEFYEEGTSTSKKDELAIEAGKLLWKEILYNTDDRTGLIDTLKQGGVVKAQYGIEAPDSLYVEKPKIVTSIKGKPSYKEWVKDVNPDYISENYDLETAYKYLPYEQMERWKKAVNSNNPEYYMNYQDPTTKEYIYHLGSVAPYGNDDYIFLKKGREKDNPELHWETDSYKNGTNGLNKTHDLVYDVKQGRYFYIKKKVASKHELGGTINEDQITELVEKALLKILKLNLK